ncbi:MAG: MdtA/MuxA family multidrug efflux RND transporter periplasmic adaptor subunit [Syntrophobacteraceae bacterium]|nr:MdtA/MuxA family multidrug efflux RND transporter periplasmic adaptor subunit [Syntrophobacteraceae bacterium]
MSFSLETEDRQGPKRGVGLRRPWVWVFAAVMAGASVCAGALVLLEEPAAAQRPHFQMSTPVLVEAARRSDINTYLSGLGTVTPLNTVAIHTRVDGQIMKVEFQEGDVVAKGSPLFEIDPRPFQAQLTEAEGQLARDRALLENATIDLKRYNTLVRENSVSTQQRDTQASLVHQYEGTVKYDQGQVDSVRVNLVYCHITSPLTGRIGLRQVDAGNIVHAADTTGLALITQEQPITVIFPIPEDSLPAVLATLKTAKHPPVDAFNREQTQKLATGSLLTIDNQIDTTTGTVKLRATFPNKDHELFPNQFVNVRLLLGTVRNAVVVPTSAVQRSSSGTFVYVLNDKNSTVSVRWVKLGPTEKGLQAISSGITPGESVVVDGAEKLTEGGKVVAHVRAANTSDGIDK